MVEHGIGIVGGQEGAGEDHGMESDIVLAHELIELHILRVLPPFLPFVLHIVGSD